MRLNQLVAKVFNGDVTEGDNRPVSENLIVVILWIII